MAREAHRVVDHDQRLGVEQRVRVQLALAVLACSLLISVDDASRENLQAGARFLERASVEPRVLLRWQASADNPGEKSI
eukprot:CAMPEP_0185415032 /NCGR_PEP_ID=MMETSP1365-20130426/6187_1 /TAXON_ID=38817 /ORGANISM="Gephyrocapsa oceanica, Strain RCC1303" /LENGTH=78 /DNA_ID=CAMNT_0028018089 /DNA_START=174 /DNA_END=410 /DNA_ORIENTATION=+